MGGRLLLALAADPEVEAVHTVARRDLPGPPLPKVVHTRADVRSPEARRALSGVDVLFHLGFQLWMGKGGRGAMESVNVAGTENVVAARPARVVLASSAAVYGAWPDNPCPLTESSPVRVNPECDYGAHKLAAERICADAAPTISLRVAAVLGAQADPAVRRAVAGYRLAVPAVAGRTQALQFIHQDDVVTAFLAAGRRPAVSGVFNVAPTDWLSAAAVAAISGGRVVTLPRGVLLGVSRLAHRLKVLPFGADRAVLLAGPLALDPSAAASRLGWRATRSSAVTLASMLDRGGA